MIKILQTTSGKGYEAVFVDLEEGFVYTLPIVLWVTILEKEKTSIVGAFISSDLEKELYIISDIDRDFWRYQLENTEIDDKEAREEIAFFRRCAFDELMDDFLEEAVEQGFITEQIAEDFVKEITYPFKVNGKERYSPSTISYILSIRGVETWQDRPQDNDAVKNIFGQWFRWRSTSEDFKFTENEVAEK